MALHDLSKDLRKAKRQLSKVSTGNFNEGRREAMPVIVDRDTVNAIVSPLVSVLEEVIQCLEKIEAAEYPEPADISPELQSLGDKIVAAVEKLDKPTPKEQKTEGRKKLPKYQLEIQRDARGNMVSATFDPVG